MKECPKCGYIRTPTDDEFISKTECPSCGVVYSKYETFLKTKHTERTEEDPQKEEKIEKDSFCEIGGKKEQLSPSLNTEQNIGKILKSDKKYLKITPVAVLLALTIIYFFNYWFLKRPMNSLINEDPRNVGVSINVNQPIENGTLCAFLAC